MAKVTEERDKLSRELAAASVKLEDWENLMAMLKNDRDKLEAEVCPAF